MEAMTTVSCEVRDNWACPQCTLVNEGWMKQCPACDFFKLGASWKCILCKTENGAWLDECSNCQQQSRAWSCQSCRFHNDDASTISNMQVCGSCSKDRPSMAVTTWSCNECSTVNCDGVTHCASCCSARPRKHRCYTCGKWSRSAHRLQDTDCPHVACSLSCLNALHNHWWDRIKPALLELDEDWCEVTSLRTVEVCA